MWVRERRHRREDEESKPSFYLFSCFLPSCWMDSINVTRANFCRTGCMCSDIWTETNAWSHVCELWWTFVFPVTQVQLTRRSISCGKRKITLLFPLWCTVLWFSDSFDWLLFIINGPQTQIRRFFEMESYYVCLSAEEPTNLERTVCTTRCRLVYASYIYCTRLFIFFISLSNQKGMTVIIAAPLSLASGNHWVLPHFLLLPSWEPLLYYF